MFEFTAEGISEVFLGKRRVEAGEMKMRRGYFLIFTDRMPNCHSCLTT